MVKAIALFKRPDDPAEFERYYREVHRPLAEKIPGLLELRTYKVFGSSEGRSEYFFAAETVFKDKASFKAGMRSMESRAAAEDAQGFAKGLFKVQFLEETGS